MKIYFGSEITTRPNLIEGDSLMKSFIAGYYQADGQQIDSSNIRNQNIFVRPKTPFVISSKTWSKSFGAPLFISDIIVPATVQCQYVQYRTVYRIVQSVFTAQFRYWIACAFTFHAFRFASVNK